MERLTYETDGYCHIPFETNCVNGSYDIEDEDYLENIVVRLSNIEDILGNEHDLDRLKQLLDACKGLEPNEVEESKFLIATQKDHEKMARLRELSLAYSLIGEQVYEPNNRGFISTYKVIGFYASECSILVKWILFDGVSTNSNGFEISALGEKVFVIREAAESALKAMKERETMAEYIERDAVISDLEAAEKHGGMGMIIANTLKQYVKRVPAADVVEVVRCKDCILHEDFPHNVNLYCNRFDGVVKSDGFCDYGKKDLEESK